MSSIKCGGGCCDRFMTSKSPREWKRWQKAIQKQLPHWLDDFGKAWSLGSKKVQSEVLTIADMLIVKETKRDKAKTITESGLRSRWINTCKHFNPKTKLCTNYKNRPECAVATLKTHLLKNATSQAVNAND